MQAWWSGEVSRLQLAEQGESRASWCDSTLENLAGE